MARVFEESGWKDANTVRRAIFALTYLDDLQRTHAELFEGVRLAPLSVVEALARLHRLEPLEARRAAKEWTEGRSSLEALRRAANSARPAGLAGSSGQFLEEEFRKRAEEAVRSAVQEVTGEVVSTGHVNYKDTPESPALDFLYSTTPKSSLSKSQAIAVLIVGPYQNKTLYRKRRFDWMLRAFGLAWSYDHVLLVLPDKKHLADYNRWILHYQQTVVNRQLSNSKPTDIKPQSEVILGPHVHVVSIEIQNIDPTDEAAIASFGTVA